MKIVNAKEEIKKTVAMYLLKDNYGNYKIPIARQRPIFMVGAPGIGKTAIMSQIAAELGIGLLSYTITHHTRQSAIGLPYIDKLDIEGKEVMATNYTMSEIIASVYQAIKLQNKKEGILFIDEINCVSETLAPAMLDLLQNKKFGTHKIPEGWVLVSAGNPSEYNKSVREFDTVTLDRVKKIEVETDFDIWSKYAYDNAVEPSIMFYLQNKPANLLNIQKTVDGIVFATPRGWEDLSIAIKGYKELNFPISFDLIRQYIQNDAIAMEFFNYYTLFCKYRETYDVKDIFNGNFEDYINKVSNGKLDEKITIVNILIDAILNETTINSVNMEAKKMMTAILNKRSKADDKNEYIESVIKENHNIMKNNIISEASRNAFLKVNAMCERLSDETVNSVKTELQSYSKLTKEIFNHLENFLLFMERCFGENQEMVLFLINIISNKSFVQFIAKNPSKKFFELNKNLVFSEKNRALMNEVDDYLKNLDNIIDD